MMTETTTTNDHGHEAPSYDDINTPVIVLVGVIASLVTLITIMFVQGLYYHWSNSVLDQRASDDSVTSAVEKIAEQKAILSGGDGILSIDNAMEKVIAQYGTPATQQ